MTLLLASCGGPDAPEDSGPVKIDSVAIKFENAKPEFRSRFIYTGSSKKLFERPVNLYKVSLLGFEQEDPYIDAVRDGHGAEFDSVLTVDNKYKHYYKKAKSIVDLSPEQTREFFDLVNDTNIYSSAARACYYPHHCFYLKDAEDKIIGYYEVCFMCELVESRPSFHNDQISIDSSALLRFKSLIAKTGLDSLYFELR